MDFLKLSFRCETNNAACKRRMTRTKSRVLRRNTMDCALLNEMFIDEECKRTDKRAQALLRDSERELKNSMALGANGNYPRVPNFHENATILNSECLDKCTPLQSSAPLRCSIAASTLVESCNRYMTVSSRQIGCRASAPPTAFALNIQIDANKSPGLNVRKEFHETFANLIKLGSVDRQEVKVIVFNTKMY